MQLTSHCINPNVFIMVMLLMKQTSIRNCNYVGLTKHMKVSYFVCLNVKKMLESFHHLRFCLEIDATQTWIIEYTACGL